VISAVQARESPKQHTPPGKSKNNGRALVLGRMNFASLARRSATRPPPSVTIVPVRRRIVNPGIRLQAEALALADECARKSFKLSRSYKEYGSDNGAWREYVHRPIPKGMDVPRRKSTRIAKS